MTRLRAAWHRVAGPSAGTPLGWRTVGVGALGMGVPVAAGWTLGRVDAGITIGLGAVLLAGARVAPGSGEVSPASAVTPALAAVAAATAIAATPWPDPLLIALASVAALVSGYSRSIGVAAIRFAVYLVLGTGLLEAAGAGRGATALIFGLGALWNIVLRVLLHDRAAAAAAEPPARTPTPAQRRAHFRRTLRTAAGWQFAFRLALGLTVASVLRHLWPGHHFFWIMLTVALLTQRPVERLPVKTVQRLVGTIAGVAATRLIVVAAPSRAVTAVVLCLLAAGVPVARARSYLLYAAVSTPLILLVLDFGRPVEMALLTDRLVATLIGGAIVIAGNLAAERLLPSPVPPAPVRPSHRRARALISGGQE